MSIKLGDNLEYRGILPLEARSRYNTKAEMEGADKRGLNTGLIAYCLEDKTHYKFEREPNQSNREGQWVNLVDVPSSNGEVDLSSVNEEIAKISKYVSRENSFIKMKYRDHYDVENGSLNFVSPLYRYFGWYVPEAMHSSTKSDDTAGSKKFYVPSVYRWIGDDSLSIETISEADAKIGVDGSRRVEPYTTEYNGVDINLFNNGFTWKHDLTNTEKTVPAKNPASFHNMKVLSTGLFHRKVEGLNLNNDQKVDIVGMYINWAGMPDGSYIRISVSKHNTAPERFRLLVKNTDVGALKVDTFLYKGFADDIKELKFNENGGYYHYDGMGESLKIEKPTERGTLIMLESRGNGTYNDTMQGLIFNVFVPEAYYSECTKGIGQNEFLYIKDMSKIGKAANAIAQFDEYRYLPSYPKNGDILKVIEDFDAKADFKPKYREFICIHESGADDSQWDNLFRNPNKGKHPNTLRYSFPIGTSVNPLFYDYYFGLNGKRDLFFTRFKEIFPNIEIPQVEQSKYNVEIISEADYNALVDKKENTIYFIR